MKLEEIHTVKFNLWKYGDWFANFQTLRTTFFFNNYGGSGSTWTLLEVTGSILKIWTKKDQNRTKNYFWEPKCKILKLLQRSSICKPQPTCRHKEDLFSTIRPWSIKIIFRESGSVCKSQLVCFFVFFRFVYFGPIQ